jgi:cell division septation protein DedD
MESRLKERLTGAAILVALIVLIVPEIFHDRRSAPTPPGVPTPARAGADAAPTRSYTIELSPERPASRVQPPAGQGRAAAATGAETAAAPAAQPGAQGQPRAETSRAPMGSAGPAPAAAATAATPKVRVPAVSPAHPRSGGWSVQLGLFAKASNAERLAHTAQSRGFAVETSRFGPRGLYRVAVAGIADRASAEQLSHRLRGAGLPAAILGPR